MKKIISFLVTACMVVTLFPAAAFADQVNDQQGDSPDVVVTEEQAPEGVNEDEPMDVEAGEAESYDMGEEAPPEMSEELLGDSQTEGWVQEEGHWLYYHLGVPVKGKQVIGYTYYFDDNGYMQTGFIVLDGYTYYFDETPGDPSTSTYGRMKTGWLTKGKDKYYFTASGIMKTGWLDYNQNKYYFGSNGKMKTGWQTINNSKYFFNTNGTMKKGWYKKSKKEWYYLNTSNGKMETGLKTISKAKYFLNRTNGKVMTGVVNDNGTRYLFNSKTGKNFGKMKTGWYKPSKKKWYYFDKKTGKAKVGKVKIKKLYYYFGSDGIMKTGVIKIKGDLYYFQVDGKKKGSAIGKGWFKASLDKKKRYSYGKGKLAVGKVKIGKKYYQFSTTNGALTKSLGDATDIKIQKNSSPTKYLVYVNRGSHNVRIYTGKKKNWTRKASYTCTVGKSSTPTPKGTFYIGTKGTSHGYTQNGTKVRYWYWSHFSDKSGLGFSSIIYYDGDTPSRVYDGTLGGNKSSGSIRLSLANAQYIYNYVPIGSKVIIE